MDDPAPLKNVVIKPLLTEKKKPSPAVIFQSNTSTQKDLNFTTEIDQPQLMV